MRKVNIMVEVSDDIYDSVVEPFKKSKKFAKLIQSLLEGYYKDDYIALFVEGSLDAALVESRSSFEDVMKSMKDSLAVMSMMENEASSMMEQGIEAVKIKEDTKESYEPSKEEVPVSLPLLDESKKEEKDKEDLNEKVRQIEFANKELSNELSSVRTLLEQLLSQKAPVKEAVVTKEEPVNTASRVGSVTRVRKPLPEIKEELPKIREELPEFVDDSEDFTLPPSTKAVKEEDDDVITFFTEEEEEYDEFLEGLLEGNMYTG